MGEGGAPLSTPPWPVCPGPAVPEGSAPSLPGCQPLGTCDFRHIQRELLAGYQRTLLAGGQEAFVATPEKALLDLVHLVPGADSPEYLDELRLQNLDRLDLDRLRELAELSGKPKLRRAAERIAHLAETEAREYVTL